MVKKLLRIVFIILLIISLCWTIKVHHLDTDQKVKVTLRHSNLWDHVDAVLTHQRGVSVLSFESGVEIFARNYITLGYYAPPDAEFEKLHWFIPRRGDYSRISISVSDDTTASTQITEGGVISVFTGTDQEKWFYIDFKNGCYQDNLDLEICTGNTTMEIVEDVLLKRNQFLTELECAYRKYCHNILWVDVFLVVLVILCTVKRKKMANPKK